MTKGKLLFPYQGGNNKDDIKKFLAKPSAEAPPSEKSTELAWADEPSLVNHLTEVQVVLLPKQKNI